MLGKAQSLGSLKSFLWYTLQLSGVSILCFSSWVSLGCTVRGGCSFWLLYGGANPASILSSPRAHCWGTIMWWLDGCIILCLLILSSHMFMETRQSQHLPFARQTTKKAGAVIQSESEDSGTRSSDVWGQEMGVPAQEERIHPFSNLCVASLVAQMVKNLPALQETRVWSLGRKDPLEMGITTHSSILVWRNPWIEELVVCFPWGHKDSEATEQPTFSLTILFGLFRLSTGWMMPFNFNEGGSSLLKLLIWSVPETPS